MAKINLKDLQQIVVCRECPFYRQIAKDFTLYCNMSKKRCIELNQIKGYETMLNDLIKQIEKR